MIDVPPLPPIWVPPKPAIIRAVDMPDRTEFLRDLQRRKHDAVFAPGFLASHGVSVPTIAFRSSVTSSTSTCGIPSGFQAGDLLVLLDVANATKATIPTAVTPSGFTNLANQSIAGKTALRLALWYKIATGSETTITGMNGTSDNNKVMLCFSGGIATATPSTVGSQGTAATPTNQTVSASGGAVPLIVLGAWGGSGSVVSASRSMSPSGTYTEPTSNFCSLGYLIYNSAPANNTVSMGDTGRANAMASCYIQLA